MTDTVTVAPAASLPLAERQQGLFLEGLEHLRQLAGNTWTDHNTHDPGITLLELLCEGLTDVAYRAALPLADLLASGSAPPLAAQFHTPAAMLPTRATTLSDYRRLLIDIPGIQNAWLRPQPLRYFADTVNSRLLHAHPGSPGVVAVDVQGLHQVQVEYRGSPSAAEKAALLAAVAERLDAHRNLGQDFLPASEVLEQPYVICAELELSAEASVASVWAAVLHGVARHLSPRVPRHSLAAMLAGGDDLASVFNGPLLQHGFIREAELQAAGLSSEIRLSDVIHLIMDIPGVLALRRIHMNAGVEADARALVQPGSTAWVIPVPEGHKATLAVEASRLVFYKRNLPVGPAPGTAEAALQALRDAEALADAEVVCEEPPLPAGRSLPVADYPPLQLQLPALYGTSEAGYPAGADAAQQAQVLQLKAYLHLFEQVLANDCAQLASLPALFSADAAQALAAFVQPVGRYPLAEKILPASLPPQTLQGLLEGPDAAAVHLARRNAVLDHLLARVGEDFAGFAAINQSLFHTGDLSLLQAKSAYLLDYPAASHSRGGAYHQRAAADTLWDSDANLAGLERRIGRLLGLPNLARRSLSSVVTDLYAELDTTPGDEFRFRVRHRQSLKILLSSERHFVTRDEARAALQKAIVRAQLPEAYQRRTTVDGRRYFNVVDETGEIIARRIEYFANDALLETAIAFLLGYLREQYSEEGFYLIENLLLRPPTAEFPFLDLCTTPDCSDCGEYDPYSHRLHWVLPAYAGRFASPGYRAYAESVLREQTPAHLLPKICWVDREAMQAIERAWRDWLLLLGGHDTNNAVEKLTALKQALQAGKNVYPQSLLNDDCASERDKFILGRTALGSQ